MSCLIGSDLLWSLCRKTVCVCVCLILYVCVCDVYLARLRWRQEKENCVCVCVCVCTWRIVPWPGHFHYWSLAMKHPEANPKIAHSFDFSYLQTLARQPCLASKCLCACFFVMLARQLAFSLTFWRQVDFFIVLIPRTSRLQRRKLASRNFDVLAGHGSARMAQVCQAVANFGSVKPRVAQQLLVLRDCWGVGGGRRWAGRRRRPVILTKISHYPAAGRHCNPSPKLPMSTNMPGLPSNQNITGSGRSHGRQEL